MRTSDLVNVLEPVPEMVPEMADGGFMTTRKWADLKEKMDPSRRERLDSEVRMLAGADIARLVRYHIISDLDNPFVAALSDTAHRLYLTCLATANSDGVFLADIRSLRNQTYWASDPSKHIGDAIAELGRLIEFYTVDGLAYGRIRDWAKHRDRIQPPRAGTGILTGAKL